LNANLAARFRSSNEALVFQEAAKDVLMQFAKLMSQAHGQQVGSSPGLAGGADALPRPPPPPYPEVTLHPVLASSPAVVSSAPSTPTTSLLHGILTKPTSSGSGAGSAAPAKSTTFSPTLARLLTAPERTSHANAAHNFAQAHLGVTTTSAGVSLNDLLATAASKVRLLHSDTFLFADFYHRFLALPPLFFPLLTMQKKR